MIPIDDGGPAFPDSSAYSGQGAVVPGMSLRDFFAAKAMEALMGDGWCADGLRAALTTTNKSTRSAIAEIAYSQADAMIAARSAS